jgi:predicted glycosyltransferase involved in capsule biosynthesis
MVFPYDGNFYNTPSIVKNLYEEKKDIAVFSDNRNRFLKVYGHFSVGGAFMVNREAYIDAGMENENFYGWGPEDIERVKRWEILGYKIKWISGALYHLNHPRRENSWHFDNNAKKKMLKEYLNICRMNKSELTNYLEKFEWIYS